jgi:hypothetical protein
VANWHCATCKKGAIRDSDCVTCDEGYTLSAVDWMNGCTGKCAAVSLAGVPKSFYCHVCPPGKYGEDLECKTCPTGKYQRWAGKTTCKFVRKQLKKLDTQQQSSAVFSSDRQGMSVSSDACAPGKYSTSASGRMPCTLCPADQFASRQGATSCHHCSPGRYQPLRGYQFCYKLPCPLGKFETFTGQGLDSKPVCKHGPPCGPGHFSDTGTKPCKQCPNGYINQRPARGRCIACSVGWSFVSTISPCFRCPAGYYGYGGVGYRSARHGGGHGGGHGQVEHEGTAVCSSCPRGYYSKKPLRTKKAVLVGCTACERGRYQHTLSSFKCINCAVGQVGAQLNQTKCMVCMPGKYFAISPGCPSGSYCSSCTACPVGYAQGYAGRKGCRSCRENMYVRGTFQPLNGQSSCFQPKIFWAKQVGQEKSKKKKSGSGFYLSLNPPEGLQADAYSWSKCASGKYIDNGLSSLIQHASQCVECTRGKYQDFPDKSGCINCPLVSGLLVFDLQA